MKQLAVFLAIALALILIACAPLQTITIPEAFVKIYDSLNDEKAQLYVKSNEWMIKTFTSATSVIEFSDKEEGTLIGKFMMHGEIRTGLYGMTNDTRTYAKIDIRVKDHKARISIEPLGSWKYDPSGLTIYDYSKEMARRDMNALAESFYLTIISDKVSF